MVFYDRFLGKQIPKLPEHFSEGRYVNLVNNEIVLNNGQSYQTNPKWSDEVITQFELVSKAVILIAERFRKNPLKYRSPLMPIELGEVSELKDLETVLAEVLEAGHLHFISQHPRLDVHYQEEVIPLPRAKRLAKTALTYLASHSECWQKRTISGIVPKKIKAELSEDFYAIYENRLYKKLLDRLTQYLSKRLLLIGYLNQNLEAFLNFQHSEQVHYRLREIICRLWGENYQLSNEDSLLQISKQSLEVIAKQLKVIKSLKQSGLYTLLPHNTHIANQIRRTNILNHDKYYKYLPKLWDELNKYQQDVLSEEQRKEWANKIQADYECYIGLLIERAMEFYDFNIEKKTFTFSDSLCRIENKHHQWRIICGEEHIFTIIPIVNEADLPKSDERTLFCSIMERENCMLISPMDLYVVEKLAKQIDMRLLKPLIADYGKVIVSVPSQICQFVGKHLDYFKLIDNNIKIIKALPDDIKKDLIALLKQYTNKRMYDQFLKKLNQINQLNQLCQCEQPNIDFRETSSGFYGQCSTCKTTIKLNDKQFSIGMPLENSDIDEFKWSGRKNICFQLI